MNAGFYPDPPSDRLGAELHADRHALLMRANALNNETRKNRAASRKIVARCVEDRIVREHRAASKT